MQFTVIGAGAIGSAVACALLEHEQVARVQVCDAHARSLQDLHRQVQKNPKLQSFQADARDHYELGAILQGSDVVIACTSPAENLKLAELALSVNSHFCDLGGNDEIGAAVLALADEARARSRWVVPNCGLAPGLVNILCLRGVEQFSTVEAAQLRVGAVPLNPEPPFNFRFSGSVHRIIDEYTHPVQHLDNGRLELGEPLSGLEDIHFEPPFDHMEAFLTAGKVSALAHELADRLQTLDYKTISWPGHAWQMRFLLGLGLAEKRLIDVRTHLTYRDVLARRMQRRLGGEHEDAVLMRVLIRGLQDGQERTLVYEMIDRFNADQNMSAMRRSTSIPAAAIAVLIAAGEVPGGGAAPPEQIIAKDPFCAMLEAHGLHITTNWYDGYYGITGPRSQAA